MSKELGNINAEEAAKNTNDLKFWGDGDTMKLISKAFSKEEQWMKSTKAMEIEDVGCIVQATTLHKGMPAEALVFVPGVKIEDTRDENGVIVSRKIVKS